MSEHIFAVIMAGGSGTRFWPMSRGGTPKQFLRLLSERTMMEETVRRIAPLVPLDRVVVVAGRAHAATMAEILPDLPQRNLILEPVARNTAPCIGLAAIAVRRMDPDAVMAVLPADHFIDGDTELREEIAAAARLAGKGRIVTIGIRPVRPETGYGYIRLGEPLGEESARLVDSFVEKPDFDTAIQYLASGRYLWNSGMFFFTPARILAEFQRHLPRHHEALMRIDHAWGTDEAEEVLEREFEAMEPISVDYGIMEKAEDIAVLTAKFTWNDVGTWGALRHVLERGDNDSVVMGRVVELGGRGNILVADKGLVAVLGIKDTVVVRTEDAVLVCPRSQSQGVRQVVEAIRAAGLDEYL